MKKLGSLLMMICCIAAIVILQYGFLFLLLAMLPSLVAYFIDGDSKLPTFKIVLATNFAATLPAIVTMINSLVHMGHLDISGLMGDPAVWLFIYSGAAFGWCTIYLCRFISRFIVSIIYDYNINSLEGLQKELVEEWGEKIRRPADNGEALADE